MLLKKVEVGCRNIQGKAKHLIGYAASAISPRYISFA